MKTLFFSLFFSLSFCLAFAQTPEEIYKQANDLAFKGEYAQAIELFDKYIELKPTSTNATYTRAWCSQFLGKHQEAVRDFTRVLEIDKTYKNAFILRGVSYFALNMADQAIVDFETALKLDPKDHVIYTNLGKAKEKKQLFSEALWCYTKALELEPTYEDAQRNKRDLLAIHKDLKIPTVERPTPSASSKMDTTAQEYFEKGFQFAEKRDFTKALEWYEKTLKIDRNHKPTYDNRGWIYSILAKYSEAIADYDRSLAISSSAWTFNQRGYVKHKLKRYEEAIADFDRALAIDSNYTAALENRKLSQNKISQFIVVDKTPPQITIISPEVSRGLDVQRMDESATVIGRATDENGIEQVLINGLAANLKPNGDFDLTLKLVNGSNKVSVVAFDFKGNKAEQVFTIKKVVAASANIKTEAKPTGKNYALIFGTDQYESWTPLNNPIKDAQTIAEELRTNYQFDTELIQNPTRQEILATLRKYAQKNFEPNDQLMIFFAGHGHFDEVFGEGYLVAKDSRKDDESFSSYLSHSQLRTHLNNIKSKHVLLVMDVCFGGTFDPVIAKRGDETNSQTNLSKIEFINRKMRFRTRRYLTSGGKEYVSDGQAGKHSPFARKFLEALRSYGGNDGILTITEILSYVETLSPEPRCGEFGDNEPGSDFIFLAK